MVRSVNPKREKKELGYFCIFLHLVFGRVFLPQLQLCTNLSKNRKIKQHCQVTLMRAFTHFIPTIKPTNERNSFRYVFSRVSNVSETNFRHAPDEPKGWPRPLADFTWDSGMPPSFVFVRFLRCTFVV